MLRRGYARDLCERGAMAMAKACDENDLTGREAKAINVVAHLRLMRLALWFWWRMYDLHRLLGLIPDAHAAENPWWV